MGVEGQKKLGSARVLVMGCGALGTSLADHMARAGVGKLRIVDRDFIEENNLQRQCLFDEQDIAAGLPKAVAAERKLQRVNSKIQIEGVVADVNYTNVERFVREADLVLDGTDNFETRFLVNDACVKHRVSWIYGGCVGSTGMTMNILPGETPCLRCVWEDAPPPGFAPTCDTAGIVGPVATVVAAFECAEALKILTGNRQDISRDLVTIDVWPISVTRHPLTRVREAADCPACRRGRFPALDPTEAAHITTLCGRQAVQITPRAPEKVDLAALAQTLKKSGRVMSNAFMLKFSTNEFELTVFPDGRAIVQGTKDTAAARTLYAKYVGH